MSEVKDILSAAQEAVDQAAIKDDLRVAAFNKAIDLLAASAGVGQPSQAQPSGGPAVVTGGGAGGGLAKVAERLRLDLATVKEVYHEADGKFDVIVSPSMLERPKSTGMKQIALLVAAARQGAELEEFTDADHIRTLADGFNKYDAGNFATDLRSMTDEFRVRKDGRKIQVKLTRPGWDRAAELVRQLGGSEQ